MGVHRPISLDYGTLPLPRRDWSVRTRARLLIGTVLWVLSPTLVCGTLRFLRTTSYPGRFVFGVALAAAAGLIGVVAGWFIFPKDWRPTVVAILVILLCLSLPWWVVYGERAVNWLIPPLWD